MLSLVYRRFLIHSPSSRYFTVSISSANKKKKDTFYGASHGSFTQSPPQLYNTFLEDSYLRECLSFRTPEEVRRDIFKDLERFGERISHEIDNLGRQAEENTPTLQQYDAWGHRIDKLVTSEAWRKLHDISAEEGVVAIGYERVHTQWSRLHQYAKLLLYFPSSGLYSCPVAMTDGAAKLIESIDDPALKERAYLRLISRDPEHFWTSGQWMTEMGGGSDVARGTSTTAIHQGEGNMYRLHGYKWFSSATDADMAFTLARIQDNDGMVTEGTQGLSLFYVETKDQYGMLNNILIEKLKNKLGTRQLPTAELLLDGTLAKLIGKEGRGVAGISPMLTITRLHNTTSAVGAMRRMLQLSRDYSVKRMAFGKFLAEHPLHIKTLAGLELETRGCTIFAMELANLLGKEEHGISSNEESLILRLMMPVVKLYTAKKCVAITSEGLESFGGLGYIEDSSLPTLYRDSQVLPIWEGTTNILSLDVLRALQKSKGEAIHALVKHTKTRTSVKDRIQHFELQTEANTINTWIETTVGFVSKVMESDHYIMENAARDFAFTLAHIYIGSLLLEKACHTSSSMLDMITIKRWCQKGIPLRSADHYKSLESERDLHLVMDGYQTTK